MSGKQWDWWKCPTCNDWRRGPGGVCTTCGHVRLSTDEVRPPALPGTAERDDLTALLRSSARGRQDVTATITEGSCPWCSHANGGSTVWHIGGTCPRVKAIEYHASGGIKRVEFHEERPTLNLTPATDSPPMFGTKISEAVRIFGASSSPPSEGGKE